LFYGSYNSFEATNLAVPTNKPLGFDNAKEARKHYSPQIFFYDYPCLFWLGCSFEGGMRSVFDLGGHTGLKFHAFRRMLEYPKALQWTVCDVQGVVQAGRDIAVERGAGAQLSFTTISKRPPAVTSCTSPARCSSCPRLCRKSLTRLPSNPSASS
jgi:putative methyltransferase (TIGR04325 family)